MPTTTFTEAVNATGGFTINGAAIVAGAALDAANTFTLAQTIAGGSTATDRLNLGADTTLYRSAANVLKTEDELIIDINGGKDTLALTNTTANVGITIGADVNLYRVAANYLKTDDNFQVVGHLMVAIDNTSKLFFGSAEDTSLWRSTTNELATGGLIRYDSAGTFQTTVGAAGGGSALPATPTKYLKVKDEAGTTFVVPCYAAA